MPLQVLDGGWLTTVQDLGRWGWQSRGVAVAGAMDIYAHRLANALVGNPPEHATLEVTLVGPEFACDDARVIAVTGAEFDLEIDGAPVPMNASLAVPAHARVRFGARRRGVRAYVAVAGGLNVPLVFGSRSTHVRTRMGGFDGRPLKSDDRIPLGEMPSAHLPRREAPPVALPIANSPTVIRVLEGPHTEFFDADALGQLSSTPYVVEPQSDRMAYRLRGRRVAPFLVEDMISEATLPGALQVPNSGEPILLMADRHTTGGYPCLATAIRADFRLAAQLGPGDSVQFSPCSPAEALSALIASEHQLLSLGSAPLA